MHPAALLRNLDAVLEHGDDGEASRLLAKFDARDREPIAYYVGCKLRGDEGGAERWRQQLEAVWHRDRALNPDTPKLEATVAIRKAGQLIGRPMIARPQKLVLGNNGSRALAAPRERRENGRRRRAATSRASGSRSGQDPGDPEESEPPPVGRRCKCGCGESLDHLRRDARYATPACRKRAQRGLDRAHPERVVDRRGLDALTFDGIPSCRCRPRHHLIDRDPEGDPVCWKCGRWVGMPVGSISGFDATVRTMQQLDRLAPRGAVVREWWTRPSRREAAKLRRTREVRKAEEVAP